MRGGVCGQAVDVPHPSKITDKLRTACPCHRALLTEQWHVEYCHRALLTEPCQSNTAIALLAEQWYIAWPVACG